MKFIVYVPCGPAMLSWRKLSGDPPETLRGGSPDILAKITGKSRQNFQKKIFFYIFVKILSGFASDLAKKSGDPPRRVSGGSPDNFRRDITAGPHGSSSGTVPLKPKGQEISIENDGVFKFFQKGTENFYPI